MSKALERRDKHPGRPDPGGGADHRRRGVLSGLKSRDLAREIGVANGAVYNLVEDMDELILRVGSRTLGTARRRAHLRGKRRPRLACARRWCASRSPIAISPQKISNCGARCSNTAWRRASLFRNGRSSEQMNLFRHIYHPLAALFPKRTPAELGVMARSLFSAVHGMVLLGLEQKLIAVPIEALAPRDCDHRAGDGRWADRNRTAEREVLPSCALRFDDLTPSAPSSPWSCARRDRRGPSPRPSADRSGAPRS